MYELRSQQGLHEEIPRHILGAPVYKGNFPVVDGLTDKVIPDRDMLRARMVSIDFREGDGRAVVALDDGEAGDDEIQDVGEEVAKPAGFLGSMGKRHVLGFGARERDDVPLPG